MPDFDYAAGHNVNAAEWLGLTNRQATDLFWVTGARISIYDVTAEIAVVCLRHLAATGKIDYDAAAEAVCAEEMA